MEVSAALDTCRDTLLLTLLISAPILAVGLVVGLLINIAQAVTQLQEQTLVFVPKIVMMTLVTVALLPWITQVLLEFSREMLGGLPWHP